MEIKDVKTFRDSQTWWRLADEATRAGLLTMVRVTESNFSMVVTAEMLEGAEDQYPDMTTDAVAGPFLANLIGTKVYDRFGMGREGIDVKSEENHLSVVEAHRRWRQIVAQYAIAVQNWRVNAGHSNALPISIFIGPNGGRDGIPPTPEQVWIRLYGNREDGYNYACTQEPAYPIAV